MQGCEKPLRKRRSVQKRRAWNLKNTSNGIIAASLFIEPRALTGKKNSLFLFFVRLAHRRIDAIKRRRRSKKSSRPAARLCVRFLS